ncbi:Zinc finger BED domain-containing protein 4 [Eumeta japonica]|uniref:Zinc finger BED domain-containing protein 4 n=1 Tax=Eumeta variegata TaxID=151549 RepID=A0A4C1UIE3_EUMVA|nr:Zinc finger BED domain-containing protein 4 [Eumeta japonica]
MSLLWKHFTNISSGVVHVNIAFGNIIRKTTASLKYHLSVKHPEKYQPTTSINDESNSDSESEAESGPSTQKRDLVEEQILTNSILQNPKSEAITKSLVKMIAVDMLPLSFVEGPGYYSFFTLFVPTIRYRAEQLSEIVCKDYMMLRNHQDFKPFEVATRLMSTENQSTLYGTANHIFIVKQILEQQDDDTENIILIKETLQEELKNRFLSNSDVTSCGLASYLDPRYKDLANEEETYRNKIKEKLMDMTERINVNEPDSSKNQRESDLDFLFDPVRSLSGNLQRMASLEGQTAIEKEMLKYDREPTIPKADNPLLWWNSKRNKYPILANFARKFLGILFKHTCRKGFSTAGNVILLKEVVCHQKLQTY